MSTSTLRGGTGPIRWWPTLRAEMARTRWSAAFWMPLTGLVLAVLASGFAGLARSTGSVQELLNWQALYITGLAAPLMALLAGLTVQREHAARSGGTLWRPVSPWREAVCRVVVMGGLSAVFHVLCFGGIAVVAVLAAVPGSLAPLVSAGLVSWVSSWALVVTAAVAASFLGLVPTFLLAVVWQVVGTLTAESHWWWALPPAWPVRANLPVLKIHANATSLGAQDVLAGESPWPALLLGLGWVVLGTGIFARSLRPQAPRRAWSLGRIRGRRPAGTRRSPYGAVALGCRGTGVTPLVLTGALLCVVVAVAYGPARLAGFYTFAVLPLGSAVTAVLAWSAHRDAWWTLVVRRPDMWRPLVAWILVRVLAMSLFTAALVALTGMTAGLARVLVLWILTGAVLALLSLVLAVRWSTAVALAAAVTWTVLAVLIGGDVLAGTTLWVFALPAWALVVSTGSQTLVAVLVCGVLVLSLAPAARHALARHARGA